jgi:diguanylate cyclase (GGDEF)-like protein
MNPSPHAINLSNLHLEFNSRVQHKLQEVQTLLKHFSQNQNADDIVLQLHSIFLALANTSKSLGLNTHSKLAQDMGSLASRLLIRNELPEPIVDDMTSLLNQLMRISNHAHEIAVDDDAEKTAEGIGTLPSSTQPLVMLQITASSDSQELIGMLQQQGYQAVRCNNLDTLFEHLPSATPAAVVLDLDTFPEHPLDTLESALTLLQQRHCPIVFLSSDDHFGARLKAVRLHGDAFFAKPIDAASINKRLHQLLLNNTSSPCRILIIEPRTQPAEMLKQQCQKICHCEILQVSSYYESLTRAIEFKPDLAIIAMDQDGAMGVDVATILNQYDSLMHLPCLLITGSQNEMATPNALHQLHQCLHYHHPDFIDSFMRALQHLIPQQRHLREQLFFDPLTGVLLENKFRDQLEAMISSAKRYGSLLNCVVLDLDHLNQVNRQYGFWVGDRVIRRLADILTKRLRRSDLIARIGGNRFAVIMPNTTLSNAAKVIGTLKDNFGLLPHATVGHTFYCSFSAGLSSFPQFENASELLAHAEKNLMAAKSQGRNRLNS